MAVCPPGRAACARGRCIRATRPAPRSRAPSSLTRALPPSRPPPPAPLSPRPAAPARRPGPHRLPRARRGLVPRGHDPGRQLQRHDAHVRSVGAWRRSERRGEGRRGGRRGSEEEGTQGARNQTLASTFALLFPVRPSALGAVPHTLLTLSVFHPTPHLAPPCSRASLLPSRRSSRTPSSTAGRRSRPSSARASRTTSSRRSSA